MAFNQPNGMDDFLKFKNDNYKPFTALFLYLLLCFGNDMCMFIRTYFDSSILLGMYLIRLSVLTFSRISVVERFLMTVSL